MTNQKVGAEDSVSIQQENRGKLDSKKKLKKVRSIRLQRLSKGGKPQHDNLSILSSVTTEGSEEQTPIEMADASPSYMKGTTSSSHAKDGFQSSQRVLTLKLKRSLTRKSSRSIKIATSKAPKSTRKQSETLNGSDAGGDRSQRVITRRLSLKPVRFLTKVPTFKSRNSSMDKGPQKSKSLEGSRLSKATCSSALKDSHFTDHIDLPEEGTVSQGASAMKVCTFSYCSLHGHRHHDDSPPVKQFVSTRRRMLKAQKSMKIDGRSKQFSNARKSNQKTKTVQSEDEKNDKNVNASKKIDESATMESTTDAVKLSATDIEILDGGVTTEGKNMEPDFEVLQISSVEEDPIKVPSTTDVEPDCEVQQISSVEEDPTKTASATDAANGIQERDQKYIKMWRMMYKHAVLSNAGKCENKVPFEGKEKEERELDGPAFDGVNSSSSQSSCEADQDMDEDNKNVIELVQKAFDEILLPEAEGLSSDDSFKHRGTGLDEVVQEKSEGAGEERNTLTSTESLKEEQTMGAKPDQRTPKSWSNLKKIILLRRFVKALEKVRNINLRRPRQLPSDANSEAEKVFLKNQTAEERKRAEEWMLDYALQKVISKLAPAQRQRVTLLIEAFETIVPFQDTDVSQQSSATVEPQAHPIQSLDDFSGHSKEETDEGKVHDFSTKILLGKESCSLNSTMELSDNEIHSTVPELQNSIVLKERCLDSPGTIEDDFSGKQNLARSFDDGEKISIDNDNIYHGEIEDSGSHSLCKPDEIINTSHEETPTNEIVNEVPEDLISNLDTENSNIKSESSGRDAETKDKIGDHVEQLSVSKSFILNGLVRSLRSNLVGSGSSSNLLDEPPHLQSEAPKSAVAEPETHQEKQGYKGMWYMVYKHMVSDMAENNSSSVIDEKESVDEGSRTQGTSVSYENKPVTNQDMHFKEQVADRDIELRQIEAIKMVEEAIDSILPDDQDQLPDRQPLTERINSEGLNQKEETIERGNRITREEKEEPAEKEGNKPNQPMHRSWSNLKKVILLRRFIKALEKVRKFNPRGPRYLPIEPDSEAEKVLLRHQDMEARKGQEEWMLDYALRQVVSKLTPARRRKVELLVEAFETVTPTIKS
ncbi:calmodulin binding protein PICBP-like [Lotus japonicus]|uniref:calmodulin binding protein PICBP-like n=1 Tax=Lotus japonicus TaxID=34305 RepID=UPI0025897F9E|nr:calmodulin binding protein PICBP-like [Lotus japonicus]